MVTATDLFCGAGGSSTGMVSAGVEVKTAANHWQLAIETHNTNHPDTDHDIADLQQTHPSRYSKTDILWISPECTNHSLAKGRKRNNLNQLGLWGDNAIDPTEERSRATMREVIEFAEHHRYPIVIVENVVDVRRWHYYDHWLTAMLNLGYAYKTLYLNAMFFDVPQSRDRWYTVFWLKGNQAPDLDFRPAATCAEHGVIRAVQAWKKPEFPWGRYGSKRQYVYRCPQCGADVKPATRSAYEVIDWSIDAPLVGERKRPLKPKTIDRIKAGLRKFGKQAVLVDLGYSHAHHPGKVTSSEQPLPTQTTRNTLSLVTPMLVSVNYFDDRCISVDDVLPTQTTANKTALAIPPFITPLRGDAVPTALGEPLGTIVAAASQHYLTIPPFLLAYANQKSPARSVNNELFAVATGFTQRVVIPPFLLPTRGQWPASILDDPLSTIVGIPQHYLVSPPWIMAYYGNNPSYAQVDEPLSGITTVQRHALIEPDADEIVENCRFRMLEPHELKRGMSFPGEYVILGNKREQVRQVGNAVACNVAEWIVRQCMETLT